MAVRRGFYCALQIPARLKFATWNARAIVAVKSAPYAAREYTNSRSPLSGRAQSIITDHCEFNAPRLSAFTVGCVLSPVVGGSNRLEAFLYTGPGKAKCFSGIAHLHHYTTHLFTYPLVGNRQECRRRGLRAGMLESKWWKRRDTSFTGFRMFSARSRLAFLSRVDKIINKELREARCER